MKFSNNKILVFIPMYNCEKQIERVIDKIAPNSKLFYEILAIDNRSEDKTIDRCAKAMGNLKNTRLISKIRKML